MYYILPHWLLGLVTGSWSKPALIYLYQITIHYYAVKQLKFASKAKSLLIHQFHNSAKLIFNCLENCSSQQLLFCSYSHNTIVNDTSTRLRFSLLYILLRSVGAPLSRYSWFRSRYTKGPCTVTSLNLECNILTRTPERFDVITIVAMFAIVATPNTIVAKNHNCRNSNHNCRIFDLPQLS